jgi:serine/threonine protein phosphatase PrpC
MEIDPSRASSDPTVSSVLCVTRLGDAATSGLTAFEQYRDECFVLAQGYDRLPNAELSARLTAETAIWGYKLIRQRPFYWQDKLLLSNRIYRSVNIAVWQKRRETGFETGIASTLSVAIAGAKNIWLAWVGDSKSYFIRSGSIVFASQADSAEGGMRTKTIGTKRFGLKPNVQVERFDPGDLAMMLTPQVWQHIEPQKLEELLRLPCETQNQLIIIAESILTESKSKTGGSRDMAVVLMKRLA